MNIKTSIYDFFSYTIPGSLYLLAIAFGCAIFGLVQIPSALPDITVTQALAIGILAYVAGWVLEPIARGWYYRLFRPKNPAKLALSEFQKEHPNLNIGFQPEDWPILLAYIKQHNTQAGAEIEWNNVMNIMLRSISFALLIFAVEAVLYFALTISWMYLGLGIVLLLLSLLTARQSVKAAKWLYRSIFEWISASVLQASSLVAQKQIALPLNEMPYKDEIDTNVMPAEGSAMKHRGVSSMATRSGIQPRNG